MTEKKELKKEFKKVMVINMYSSFALKKAFVIKGKLWDSRICQNKYNQSGKYFADNYYSNVIEYTKKELDPS